VVKRSSSANFKLKAGLEAIQDKGKTSDSNPFLTTSNKQQTTYN
jgi:hypothetical protein